MYNVVSLVFFATNPLGKSLSSESRFQINFFIPAIKLETESRYIYFFFLEFLLF